MSNAHKKNIKTTPITTQEAFDSAFAKVKQQVFQLRQHQLQSESGLMTDEARQVYKARRKKLVEQLPPDSLLILSTASEQLRNGDAHYPFRPDSSFYYLTGFSEPQSILVLTNRQSDGDATKIGIQETLFLLPKNIEREIWDGKRLGPENSKKIGIEKGYSIDEFSQLLPELLKDHQQIFTRLESPIFSQIQTALNNSQRLQQQGEIFPTSTHELDPLVNEMRLIKDAYEIQLMQIAGDISALAHLQAMHASQNSTYEFEVQAPIDQIFKQFNSVPAYTTIVGSGPNACTLHYISNNAPVGDDDLILIDAGAEFESYAGDITRTFPARGKFNQAQQKLYDAVLKAQLEAVKFLKSGMPAKKYHEAATKSITQSLIDLGLLKGALDENLQQQTYKRFFMHGTGHWLGLDVHDVGTYKPAGQTEFRPLQAGMVVTVEPGIYIAPDDESVDFEWRGIGIRIEDDVLITENEPVILTGLVPKTVADIEAWMALKN